jgi:pimeloyl-ACP methyl ester carboxylesterase
MTAPGAKRAETGSIEVLGHRLEYRWIGPQPGEAPTIVFLHEGLGSAGLWRDFPERVAAESGCSALLYSRAGHGGSSPAAGSRSVRYLHDEALETLPAVIARFRLEEVVLFGHSDGASMAILYGGTHPGSVRAMVLEAPHVFVEPVTVEGVRRIADEYDGTRLAERLRRHHGVSAEPLFRAWAGIWLSPEFRAWNIVEHLSAIECPVLVVQGEDDPYGTLGQVEAIVRQVRGPASTLVLPGCGHSPHAERAGEVLKAAAEFIRGARRAP